MSATYILAAQQAESILQWYIENGVDEVMSSTPVDRLASLPVEKTLPLRTGLSSPTSSSGASANLSGTPEAKAEAFRLVGEVKTLDVLKEVILKFEGLSLKKTAMNMVFSAGNPSASVMVIGDAPEAEDDRAGYPFSGEMGQLTDKMFGAIGLTRESLYLTNVLNWRPPGNRSPLSTEIELSVPFIRRHIELVNPKIIYLMGSVASKSILGSDLTIGKLRGKQHMVGWEIQQGDTDQKRFECSALVSYHPSFLLRSPLKKREAWDDLLLLKSFL